MTSAIGKVKARRLEAVWPDSISLPDAMRRAGIKTKDRRAHQRYRRQTEAMLGIELPPHNPQHNSAVLGQDCPSYLDHKALKSAKAFVITSAVNNTTLNDKFFDTLELFAKEKAAQLVVIPQKYRHMTFTDKTEYFWPKRVHEYALHKDVIINKNLTLSSLNIVATAVNPLSGLEANSGARSAVYGATQVALQCVATPGKSFPKLMMTTGACTSATYTKTKSGGKAKFHHSFSALFVVVVGQIFHQIHLHWDGKGFQYLDEYYTPNGKKTGLSAEALVQGDSHVDYTEPKVLKTRKRLLERVSVSTLVFHDLHDNRYQSHHNTVFDAVKLARAGKFLVEEELQKSADLLNSFGKGYNNLIVGSNHNDHLDQFLNRFDPKKDPHNAVFAWELSAQTIKSGKPALETWMEGKLNVSHKFLSRNEPYLIVDTDVSQHGDKGINGSRGSAKAFAKLATKTVIGHSHTPCIEKGCYQVGVSALGMEYAQGLSSWAICDCLIYPNGKRALIFQRRGKTIGDFA